MLKKIISFSILVFSLFVLNSNFALAETPNLDDTSALGGGFEKLGGTSDSNAIVNKINTQTGTSVFTGKDEAVDLIRGGISIALGFFATVTLFFIVLNGFKIIISNGKLDSYQAGLKQLRTAVIAMVLILLSYAISKFVLDMIKVLAK